MDSQSMIWFVIQMISAVAMVVLILIQNKGVGLSGAFGGESTFYRSKRGVEKLILNLTIVTAAAFLLSSFLSLYSA